MSDIPSPDIPSNPEGKTTPEQLNALLRDVIASAKGTVDKIGQLTKIMKDNGQLPNDTESSS